MALVKFFRGSKANYEAGGKHLDAVYFAKDTKELLLNGVAYGLSSDELSSINEAIATKVATIEFTEPSTIVFKDGNDETVQTITIAEATQDQAGLMSADDKAKLDGLKSGSELEGLINAVASDLADETSARITKDNELEGKINTNAQNIQKNAEDIALLLGTGSGTGSIQDRIDSAIEQVVGSAEDYRTLGDLEGAIKAEVTRATGVEQGLQGHIDDINEEIGDKSSATVTATTVWGAIEELESEALSTKGDVDDAIAAVQKELTDFKNTKGVASGLASLDENGHVPASQLPSFVDDVVEANNLAAFPTTGEASKIYVALDTNKTYRWSGSQYVEISASLALGETTGTAYEGSKGKANADAIAAHVADVENPHQVTKAQVGLGNVENLTPAQMPVSDAVQVELDKKADTETVNGQIDGVNTAIGKVADDLAAEVERSTKKDEAHDQTLGQLADADSELAGRLDVIEGDENQAGSIKKALVDAKAYADSLLEWGEEA